jgi:hypothetical protein
MSSERRRTAWFATLAVVVALSAAWVWWHPLVWPATWIERHIAAELGDQPTIVTVRTLIESRNWKTRSEDFHGSRSHVVVEMGRDALRRTEVFAEFTFDRFGQLVELRAWRGVQD